MLAEPVSSRCWVEIDLAAIRRNARKILQAAPGAALLAVVKADAYGHGAPAVAAALEGLADIFGVASLAEALAIAAPGREIMLLSPCLPEERAEVVRRNFIATVSSAQEAAAFAAYGPCRVNFKVDTGMGRLGCLEPRALQELEAATRLPGVVLHSISTHLPSADCDPEFTRRQLARWEAMRPKLARLAPHARFHALNSAGVLGYPCPPGDIVRAGLALYGCAPSSAAAISLEPALAWKTRVVQIRCLPAGHGISYGRTFITPHPMRVAVLAAGYADGYPRQLSGRGAEVLVGGARRAVLGRVTMDLLVVDASSLPEIEEGEEAVLLGRQGAEEISAAELASRAMTIPWHIFTGITGRTRRLWKNPATCDSPSPAPESEAGQENSDSQQGNRGTGSRLEIKSEQQARYA